MIAERLRAIEARIDDACATAGRPRSEVRLVAVSKSQPDAQVIEAYQAGQRIFGENYVQELERHAALFPAGSVEWHVIGHLQTNKAKRAGELAQLIHSVDSAKLARALKGRAVLIEVNIGGEEAKAGVAPDAVEALITAIRSDTEVRGLMCIPPPDDEPRRWFAALRALRDRLRESTGLRLPDLSMGMSGDFEEAILEGATWVRVGTALLGERLA